MTNILNTLQAGAYIAQILDRGTDLVRYPNHPFAVVQIRDTPKGKYQKEKVLKHFVFKTIDEATTSAQNYIDRIKANLDTRQAEKAARKEKDNAINAADHFKEGDIVVNCWGCEQTNIDWYQVVKVTDKTIKVKEIAGQIEKDSMYSHGMACNVIPCKDEFVAGGDEYTLRVKSGYNRAVSLSNPQSYYYMHQWDGKPQYKSWYA